MQGRILSYVKALPMEDMGKTLRQLARSHRKVVSVALAIVVILSTGLITVVPAVTNASETNVLANGSFEHGFVNVGGCGVVGAQWNCFTNGGAAHYGFYDDEWEPVVADGHNSQLIEINTKGIVAGDQDRYAGISQTVRVQSGARYTFSMQGIIRTTNVDGEDPYRYTVEVGIVNRPNATWQDVHENAWTDVGWYTYFPREEPGYLSLYNTAFMADSDVVTVFIRLRKKWFAAEEEVLLDLDAISLVGPSATMQAPNMGHDKGGPEQGMGGTGGPVVQPYAVVPDQPVQLPEWKEMPGQGGHGGQCVETNLVFNGDFESGFNETGYGSVGRGWGPFTNGGAANYGFYDEQWEAVISGINNCGSSCNPCNDNATTGGWRGVASKAIDMGWGWTKDRHAEQEECTGNGQLIEINSKNMFPADPERTAGIFQRIGGLTPGATYTLQLRGLLRGTGDESDEYRFNAYWGINAGPDTDWNNVDHWEEMDLGPIYPRTEPGPLGTYRAVFRAPSSQITLFIRAQNKWAIPNVELDFNLDDISLMGCSSVPSGGTGGGTGGPMPEQPMPQPPQNPGNQCTYTVRAGDSLARIAGQYGVTLAAIVSVNDIADANLIFVGQVLTIPGCGGSQEMEVGGQPMISPVMQSGPAMQSPMVMPTSSEQPENEMSGPMDMPMEQPAPEIPDAPVMPITSDQVMPNDTIAVVVPEAVEEPDTAITYTVREGQSLGQIALENGVDANTLVMANNIQNPDIVYPGQVLRIPWRAQ